MSLPRVGTRVRTCHPIVRDALFTLEVNKLGTVTLVQSNLLRIKMDECIPGDHDQGDLLEFTNQDFGIYFGISQLKFLSVSIETMEDLVAFYFEPERS